MKKDIKSNVAKNLVYLRQKSKLTQGELAKKINYTDKSISKWEHGDAIPSVEVLSEIADFFGVTIDFLISDNAEQNYDKVYNLKENVSNKIFITALAVSIVWLIATILYVYGLTFTNNNHWILFVASVPISSIVLLVFNGIWGKRKNIFIITSVLQWSILATIFLAFLIYFNAATWPIFILGVPVQIGIILWSLLKPSKKQ